MLHFNDASTYISRDQPGYDPLHKLTPFLDGIKETFSSVFSPGQNLSLDEAMCAFRGRIHFRVYNHDKPDAWGIKLFQICDSKTGYSS